MHIDNNSLNLEATSGTASVNGINMYYEVYGEGEPLLLIEGLGYSSWMWYKQLPELSKHYKVIVYDNRGVGLTDKPDSEYTIELMADDAAALLTTLGIESAHVLGVSMGGYIAQELAIRHPEKVRSLVLACTNMGEAGMLKRNSTLLNGYLKLWGLLPGMLEVSGKASVPTLTNNYGLSKEDKILYGLSSAFTKEYFRDNPEEIDRIVKWRLDNPQPSYAWKRQFAAGVNFDSSNRAGGINVPTLVISGSKDIIVPNESSIKLAETIPGAELKILPGAGHLMFIERSVEFNESVTSFIDNLIIEKMEEAEESDEENWLKKLVSSINPFRNGLKKNPYRIKKGF